MTEKIKVIEEYRFLNSSPDKSLIALLSKQNELIVLNIGTSEVNSVHSVGDAFALQISPNNAYFAFVESPLINMYSISTGTLVHQFEAPKAESHYSELAFSLDSQLLVRGGADGILRWWNTQTGKLIRKIRVHKRHSEHYCFLSDTTLLSYSDDGLKVWSIPDGKMISSTSLKGNPNYIFYSNSNNFLVSLSQEIKMNDIDTGFEEEFIDGSEYEFVNASERESEILLIDKDNLESTTRKEVQVQNLVQAVDLSLDGKMFAMLTRDEIVLADTSFTTDLKRFAVRKDMGYFSGPIKFLADGKGVISGSMIGALILPIDLFGIEPSERKSIELEPFRLESPKKIVSSSGLNRRIDSNLMERTLSPDVELTTTLRRHAALKKGVRGRIVDWRQFETDYLLCEFPDTGYQVLTWNQIRIVDESFMREAKQKWGPQLHPSGRMPFLTQQERLFRDIVSSLQFLSLAQKEQKLLAPKLFETRAMRKSQLLNYPFFGGFEQLLESEIIGTATLKSLCELQEFLSHERNKEQILAELNELGIDLNGLILSAISVTDHLGNETKLHEDVTIPDLNSYPLAVEQKIQRLYDEYFDDEDNDSWDLAKFHSNGYSTAQEMSAAILELIEIARRPPLGKMTFPMSELPDQCLSQIFPEILWRSWKVC